MCHGRNTIFLSLVPSGSLTDGVILGSRVFVEDQYRKNRGLFSEKRETGARPMKGAEYGGLCTVRQLRVDVYGHCAPA